MSNSPKEYPEAILRLTETKARTGWSKASIYAGMKDGSFPQSIRLGRRAVGWLASEIQAFIEARKAASRSPSVNKPR
jgi:prophage regulatory protein